MQFETLETLIRQQMRKRRTPGLALAVIKDGEVIFSKGFGLRTLKEHLPMTPDTLIGIGSVSKSFTAAAIVMLEERGLLSLEDSVADYLKGEPFRSRPQIKIKHLLSHSSGMPSVDAGMQRFQYAFDDFSRTYPASSREELLAHMGDAGDYILYEPGERFFYNNDGYTCLAYILEDVTGQSFEAFLQDNLLTPLGMTRAALTKEAFDRDGNVMTGYVPDRSGGRDQLKASDVPIGGAVQAPGGIYASMTEMLGYARCLLDEGRYQGQQILKPCSLAKLFTPQIPTPYGSGLYDSGPQDSDKDPHYGLGWIISGCTETVPYKVVQHSGSMGTSSSNFVMVPELKLGIMVAENASTGICPVITDSVLATLLGHTPEEAVEDLRIDQAVEDIEGTYRSPHGMYQFRVYRQNGVLQVDTEIDDGRKSFPLLVRDLNKLRFACYSLRADSQREVAFIREGVSGRAEYVAYDRYLYRRE
ncbi:serine hydrolase domain-containing protein [Kordiimonas sp.]|uniref:serine hydrolase domain-containing protein n=1 Tax=Kordiimonas sp. TaxID=1970157 RepID=UPI003A90DBA5